MQLQRLDTASTVTSSHPSPDGLAAFATGTSSSGASLLISMHVESCGDCRRRMAQLGVHVTSPPIPEFGDWIDIRHGVKRAHTSGASSLGEVVYVVSVASGVEVEARGLGPIDELLVLNGGLYFEAAEYGCGDFLSCQPHARLLATAPIGFTALVAGPDPAT